MKKGRPATAGSKMLENFISPFDATVITRLAQSDPDEKTESVKLAEFGLADPGEIPGTPLLCNDVFGHVRRRAVQQGLFYIRPTYGTVSRFGLIPVASSMDQIGAVCKTAREGFALLSSFAGFDENDGAMFPEKNYSYKADSNEIKWGVLPDDKTAGVLTTAVKTKTANIGKNILQACESIMLILGYAEISGNISRYDGIKFGYRTSNYANLEELYTKTRTEGFGPEAKLAAITGCMALSKNYYGIYYDKAMRIRRLIKDSLKFDEYDVLVLPIESPIAILAGLPSLSFEYRGTAIQLAAGVKKENTLLRALEILS